jgi:DNA-directed RNA polymerase specialized sigma24 family protein
MGNPAATKKTAKSVPEERAATPAEIEAAVNELSEADWYRLRSYAERLDFFLQERAHGRDLLGEAFERLLRGSRKWDKTKLGLVKFLMGAMRSVCNAWFRAKVTPTEQARLASSLTVEDDEGHTSDPVDTYAAEDPSVEELLVFRDILASADTVLADDEGAQMILEGFRGGLEPPAIRELWNFSQKEYDTIITRMRRKLRRAGIVPTQQGGTYVQ